MLFQHRLTGKLGAELAVNSTGGQAEDLSEAPPHLRSQLPERVDAADTLWQGWTSVPTGRKLTLIVLEPAPKGSRPVLYADLNFDGRFSAAERFEFQETVEDPSASGDVMLHIPLQDQPFQKYPVRLRLPRPGYEPFGRRALLRTPFAYVSGTVNIGGKPVLVWVQYDPKRGGAFPDYGWQGMDVNQDGRIQTGANSPEYTFAKDERVIFKVNGREVSITNVDLVNRTISFREHPSGSSQRILLHKGSVVPDFTFRDLAGQEHKLSNFRGKYVLLDFWGTWCPPCIRLLPELQSVHEQFRDRGLIVLGLPSHEENSQAPRLMVEKQGVTFLQAEPESVRVVVEKQFRINMFPTHLLIDMDGRVMEDGEALRPPNLSPLLDRILPKE
jgi:thiol-disulfide isomerase/thioredoxin